MQILLNSRLVYPLEYSALLACVTDIANLAEFMTFTVLTYSFNCRHPSNWWQLHLSRCSGPNSWCHCWLFFMQNQIQSIEIILALSSEYIRKWTSFTPTAITSSKPLSSPVWIIALASSLVSPKSAHSPKKILLASKSDHDTTLVQNLHRFPMSSEQKPMASQWRTQLSGSVSCSLLCLHC